jgi:hypothetical protein
MWILKYLLQWQSFDPKWHVFSLWPILLQNCHVRHTHGQTDRHNVCNIRYNIIYYPIWIYLLLTHPPIYLINYLPTYYPPTYLLFTYILPYTFLPPTCIHTYLYFSFSYNLPTYLPTYQHIIYFPIHPLTYLILTIMHNH